MTISVVMDKTIRAKPETYMPSKPHRISQFGANFFPHGGDTMKNATETNRRKKRVNESNLEKETTTIFEAYDELVESDRKTSSLALKVGNHLIAAKVMARKEKTLWKTYCEETLSDIPPYEIRDCMYIATRYSQNPLPCLRKLNRTNLKKFFQFCKDKSPKSVLSRNDIDQVDKDSSEEEIKRFRGQVLKLLQSARKRTAGTEQKEKRQLDQQPSDNGAVNNTIFYRKELMRIMEKTLKKPRIDVKPFNSKTHNSFLKFQATLKKYISVRAPRDEEA